MNREDIIRMAREAGVGWAEGLGGMPEFLERFAALVAAAERKRVRSAMKKAHRRMSAYLIAAEREAMVALAAKQGWAMKNEDPFEDAVREIAAIRARGQT